jgi:hypothetical protein
MRRHFSRSKNPRPIPRSGTSRAAAVTSCLTAITKVTDDASHNVDRKADRAYEKASFDVVELQAHQKTTIGREQREQDR